MSDLSPNGMRYTHWVHIQDARLCRNSGMGYGERNIIINGKKEKLTYNGNPGVWYIEKPLRIKIGDVLDGLKVVDIREYPPQPTLRTLYFVEESHG